MPPEEKKTFAEEFDAAFKKAAELAAKEEASKTPEQRAKEREDAVPEDPRAYDDEHLKVP